MRSALFCSVLGVVLTVISATAASSAATAAPTQQQQATADDKADHNTAAQPATSYSSVVYHDAPPQLAGDGGGGGGGGGRGGAEGGARVTKAAALADIASAGAESSASFRLYHPKLEEYVSGMNPSLVQSLMKQQPQTFSQHKAEQSAAQTSAAVAQAATKLLYPPKKYKSVAPGSQQTAFNVGYSIGFGGGTVGAEGGGGGRSRQPHPQALVGHEEVVTGKPKLRVRVEGKNSVWKQISPNVEMSSSSSSSSSSQGRFSFDHDQALGQSNTFDASNAVGDPLQLPGNAIGDPLHLQPLPLSMPLAFPLPLSAFDNVFIPPQTSGRQFAAHPVNGQFRTGHSLQLKPSEGPLIDTKPLGSLHSVHTVLPQDNMFHQSSSPLQAPDGLALPAMQHVFITGANGQMVPAYLIPVAALGPSSQPLPRHPPPPAISSSSFFPNIRPTSATSASSSHPPRDSDDRYQDHPSHHQHQQQQLMASAASPRPERLKPFRPSQPLGVGGFTVSSNPHTHAHAHAHRQRSPYVATRSVVTDLGFKAVEAGDQRQVPSSMFVLKPPAPEKSSGSESSFSYQMFEHPQPAQAQSAPAVPKYRTIVQLRPVQTGLLPGLRPSRDLAGEQTILNAILSQELMRKNSAARNAPIIAQTVYGVRSYR